VRINIPGLPYSIHLERRERTPTRWRLRLRSLMILVALVALALGGLMVEVRSRREAWARAEADRAIIEKLESTLDERIDALINQRGGPHAVRGIVIHRGATAEQPSVISFEPPGGGPGRGR